MQCPYVVDLFQKVVCNISFDELPHPLSEYEHSISLDVEPETLLFSPIKLNFKESWRAFEMVFYEVGYFKVKVIENNFKTFESSRMVVVKSVGKFKH